MRVNLNETQTILQHDTLGMLALQAGYADQFREGRARAQALDLPARPGEVHEVVIVGTGGGSAASAALLRSYLFRTCRVPIQLVQGYNLPAYVDENSIVIAVSHSGKTEEILSAFRQVKGTGAVAMAIGAGGPLRDEALAMGGAYLEIPGGMMPRVAIGYLVGAILTLLARWELIPDPDAEFAEAVSLLEELAREYAPEVPVEQNLAKQVTRALAGKIPVIYGSSDHLDAVAWRIKNQLGENGKYMAFWNTIPHLHHDEAVGWDMQPDLLKQLGFLLLRDEAGESEQMVKRWQATREILQERAGAVVEVRARGQGLLARMLSLVMLGDYVSCYMAIEKGVDPTPVAIIDLFKRKVGQ